MTEDLTKLPRPKLELVRESGNAMVIIARAGKAMQKAGWTKTQIIQFRQEATSGNYDHLLQTVMKYCDEPDDGE